jgi:hypothetical protein
MATGDVNAEIIQLFKTQAWFDANTTVILESGQVVHLKDTGAFKVGDGTTTLVNLIWKGVVVLQKTGTTIDFKQDGNYGTIASPETGNITASISDARLGVTNIIIHNSGTAPTFSSPFKKLSGSSSYVINVINYIMCQYVNDTEIVYSINQRT